MLILINDLYQHTESLDFGTDSPNSGRKYNAKKVPAIASMPQI